VKIGWCANQAESIKEGYGFTRAVLPMMLMMTERRFYNLQKIIYGDIL
jgi:hypothetical protein